MKKDTEGTNNSSHSDNLSLVKKRVSILHEKINQIRKRSSTSEELDMALEHINKQLRAVKIGLVEASTNTAKETNFEAKIASLETQIQNIL